LRSMQEDYRIRARSNVMTLTRTRARLSGNQIGVCSPRATASSPSLGSMLLTPPWRAVEDDVYAHMEASGLAVDEPASDLQAWQLRIFSPVRLGGAPWRRHFNFGLMIVRSRRQSGPRGCAARSQRMTRSGHVEFVPSYYQPS